MTILHDYRLKLRYLGLFLAVIFLIGNPRFSLADSSTLVTTSSDVDTQTKQSCRDMPDGFNRSIGDMTIRRGRDGNSILDVSTYLNVRNTAREDLDLSHDLIVRIGSEVVAKLNRDAMFRYASDTQLFSDGVRCGTTCYSNCGSIFGDGTCDGNGSFCSCNYGFTWTVPLPTVKENDIITVELQAVSGSRRDEREHADNRMSAQFLGHDRTLSHLRSPAR